MLFKVKAQLGKAQNQKPAQNNGSGSSVSASAGTAEREGRTVQVHIDEVKGATITGLAYLPSAPAQRLTVRALSQGKIISSGIADIQRHDAQQTNVGDVRCGFSLHLPDVVLDGKKHLLTLTCEGPGGTRSVRELDFRYEPKKQQAEHIDDKDLLYVPGREVVCAKPNALANYHTAGWHEPEDICTWIDGVEGTIEVVIRRPTSVGYQLGLEVVPNDSQQTLEVFFNYFRVGFFEVPRQEVLSVALPSELFILRRSRLSLHCRSAIAAAQGDTRRLGIGVCRWSIG